MPIITQGEVYTVSGTLTEQQSLIALFSSAPGVAGGVITVPGYAINDSTIQVDGGYGAGTEASLQVAGDFVVAGTLVMEGGYRSAAGGGIGAQALVTGTLANNGSVFVAGGGVAGYPSAGGYGSTLVNDGVIVNAGYFAVAPGQTSDVARANTGGVLVDNGSMDNAGMLIVESSYIDFGASLKPSSSATLLLAGQLTNTGSMLVTGGLTDVGFGGVVIDSGTLTNSGTLSTRGGESHTRALGRADTGATIEVTGVLHNQGSLDIGAGMAGASGYFAGAGSVVLDRGTIQNDGRLSIDAAGAGANATLEVLTGGTLIDTGLITGGGTLTNDGVIVSGAGSDGQIASVVANQGRIELVAHSALDITGVLGSEAGRHGVLEIAAYATLTLASVAASQQVAFTGSNATLALGEIAGFGGTIDFLRPDTAIDFQHADVISAITSGNTLVLGLAGGTTFDLALGHTLANNASLSLISDNAGGTELVVGLIAPHAAIAAGEPSFHAASFSPTGF